MGSSHQGVALIARHASRRPVRHDGWVPGPGRLTLADREEITLGLHGGEPFTVIAARLGKAVSTVSREVAANGGRERYRAWRAHQRAREQARRPKTAKLACPRLAAQAAAWLGEWWPPVQIAGRLRIEFPHDPMMRVSHETIYQALYGQGRGELRRERAGGGSLLAAFAVTAYPASCHVWLGDFAKAASYGRRAIEVHESASPEERSPSREAIARVDLAIAVAGQGEPGEAAELGCQALGSPRLTGSVCRAPAILTPRWWPVTRARPTPAASVHSTRAPPPATGRSLRKEADV